ncbi:hypothetical protein HU200_046149 [Digitaria exilis]|uniref:F-box protein n=1 Tax=Digitaria exilis TaxID=1010633 RepID=A0A835AZF9_9POAL|nr:hypothetical protein HU200_046149 [Digitaria exilis]
MPDLHKPKSSIPLSLFVPSADPEGRADGGSSVFVMESILRLEVGHRGQLSHQFEAFVYRKPTMTSFSKSWHCQFLPPPPFVCEPSKYCEKFPMITSYAVIGGGSRICISAEGASTYCLDTVSHTWSHEFEWTLPFHGKVEYVPELSLWFGLSAKDGHLAAADLSNMDSQPQIVGVWKDLNLPKEWQITENPHLVNLGSGRFVIARFFQSWNEMDDLGTEINEDYFVVLTGVEMGSNGNVGNAKVQLGMNTHISRRHTSYGPNGTIMAVF